VLPFTNRLLEQTGVFFFDATGTGASFDGSLFDATGACAASRQRDQIRALLANRHGRTRSFVGSGKWVVTQHLLEGGKHARVFVGRGHRKRLNRAKRMRLYLDRRKGVRRSFVRKR
jgi:hypothetical protein